MGMLCLGKEEPLIPFSQGQGTATLLWHLGTVTSLLHHCRAGLGDREGREWQFPVLEGMVCLVIQKLLLWVTRAGKCSPAQSKQGHAGVCSGHGSASPDTPEKLFALSTSVVYVRVTS